MAQWHLDALSQALTQRGWSHSVLDDSDAAAYPLEGGLWSIHRGPVSLILELACWDTMGNPLPSTAESYALSVREHSFEGLYFFKKSSPKWKPALKAFLDSLDGADADDA